MATDEMGNMRECRTDCAWIVLEGPTATCALANLAVTQRTALRAFELEAPDVLSSVIVREA